MVSVRIELGIPAGMGRGVLQEPGPGIFCG
jgi:hypothetical protein